MPGPRRVSAASLPPRAAKGGPTVSPGTVHVSLPGYSTALGLVLSLVATKGGTAHGRPRKDAGKKARAEFLFSDDVRPSRRTSPHDTSQARAR